ncbi:MAG: Crp/Fnr family transcriptional regulator [Terriglobales bacterium]
MTSPMKDADGENQLLASMSAETLKRLKPQLSLVHVDSGKVLYGVDDKVEFVYFPRRGAMVSLLAVTEEGDTAEVGVTGYEGAIGLQAVLGGFNNTFDYLVQLTGDAWKLKAEMLRTEFRRDQPFQNAIMRYMQASFAQISQTALCNRLHNVEERISRWLLLCHDRAADGQITLTHEMLGKMLGTRRSTVSLAAATLQQAGMIEYNRGRITILDRKALERASCTCYSIVKKQFDGLYS